MLNVGFAKIVGAQPKVTAAAIIVVANAIVWYFYSFSFIMNVLKNSQFSSLSILMVWIVNFIGMVSSAIIGASLIYRFKSRIRFLFYWMFIGIPVSLIPLAINITTYPAMVTFSLFVGIYFGLGMPICLGYFASITESSNRARIGGLIFLIIFISYFIFGAINISGIELNSIALSLWKTIGLAALFFLKPYQKEVNQTEKISYSFVLKNKSFILYFIPWLMFSVVNSLAPLIISNYFTNEIYQLGSVLENVIAAILAVAFGFFADAKGRKRLAVAGFALLGLGYGCLGLFPRNNLSSCFYFVTDGFAWGAFYTIFILTLWGDIAQEKGSEKYYALGSLPYIFSNFIRISINSTGGTIVPDSSIFSFASLFLFAAVLPLFFAPETLPERAMKDRDLKSYLEKAQKIVQKEDAKNPKKTAEKKQENPEEVESEKEENAQEYDEARKLAEKYY